MKRIEIIKINLILMALMLIAGYGILTLIGLLMSSNVPIPVMIIGFCYLVYRILRKEI